MVLKRTVASTVAYLTQNEVQSAHVESTQHCGISLFVCWGGGLGVGGGISSLYLKHLIKNIWSWQAGRGGGGGGRRKSAHYLKHLINNIWSWGWRSMQSTGQADVLS